MHYTVSICEMHCTTHSSCTTVYGVWIKWIKHWSVTEHIKCTTQWVSVKCTTHSSSVYGVWIKHWSVTEHIECTTQWVSVKCTYSSSVYGVWIKHWSVTEHTTQWVLQYLLNTGSLYYSVYEIQQHTLHFTKMVWTNMEYPFVITKRCSMLIHYNVDFIANEYEQK